MLFKEINDVKIRLKKDTTENFSLLEKEFEIMFIHEEITVFFDFINIHMQDMGNNWIYVIRYLSHEEYLHNKEWYGRVASNVHNCIVPFLLEEYQYVLPDMVFVDHENRVYVLE